ncbi:hypothetical protein N665_0129s0060 [Sinapis alba]|nr:hypothetical protein N665_0129s0060 [Sinapis alba]
MGLVSIRTDCGDEITLAGARDGVLCRRREEMKWKSWNNERIYTEECHFFVDPFRRPGYFDFDGGWLLGHGVGIHHLQSTEPEKLLKKTKINPKDNHISFQCESMEEVEKNLKQMEIEYVRAVVEEGGIQVDQLFFHDPDGFMIEICN